MHSCPNVEINLTVECNKLLWSQFLGDNRDSVLIFFVEIINNIRCSNAVISVISRQSCASRKERYLGVLIFN